MTFPKLTIVYGEDWAGLYVDGDLYYEHHSIEPHHVANALGVQMNVVSVDDTWLNGLAQSNLPPRIEDVVESPNYYDDESPTWAERMVTEGKAKLPDKNGKVPRGTPYIIMDPGGRENGYRRFPKLCEAFEEDYE